MTKNNIYESVDVQLTMESLHPFENGIFLASVPGPAWLRAHGLLLIDGRVLSRWSCNQVTEYALIINNADDNGAATWHLCSLLKSMCPIHTYPSFSIRPKVDFS